MSSWVVYNCCLLLCLVVLFIFVFFFKQKTAYEMRISDWSSDVCSSDLSKYWMISGRSKPYCRRMFSTSACELASPAMATAGSPESRSVQKPTRETTMITRRLEARRVRKEIDRLCRDGWSPAHEKKSAHKISSQASEQWSVH